MDFRLKICGITEVDEINLLSRLAVDFVGIWHGINGGHADLPFSRFQELVSVASATGTLEPVLVTFLKDPDELQDIVARSGIGWLQLHGFQPPSLISALKNTFGRRIKIIKVLHVLERRCVEQGLIDAYERAGVDVFLFDAATAYGRIGSTGQRLDSNVVRSLAGRLTKPFLLAGGISADSITDHRLTIRHPNFFGIDVDTAARGVDGRLSRTRIEDLSRSWIVPSEGGRCHAAELH